MPLPSFLAAQASVALACLVVHVQDGDTLSADCAAPGAQLAIENRPRRDGAGTYPAAAGAVVRLRVRLAEVDAPENSQPFGDASRRALVSLCFHQLATITPETTDKYGRTVAHVRCAGHEAGTEQVRAGLAWVFDRYARDRALYQLQDQARGARLGLWAEPAAIPPWNWRREQHAP